MFIAQPAQLDVTVAEDDTRVLTHTPKPVSVVLLPCNRGHGPGPIVAERLPLWVSRETGPFADYRERYPEQVKFLSRQHAYLYYEDDQLYLQDLGSANGSELNGQRIDAKIAIPLCDGDRLSFGNEFFSFTLKLERITSGQTSPRAIVSDSAAQKPGARTHQAVAIHSAESFPSIFCDKPATEPAGNAAAEGQPAAAKAAALMAKLALRRIRMFSQELHDALAGENRSRRRRSGLIAAMILLLLLSGLGGGLYWHNAAQWEVMKLLKQQQYPQSLARVKDYLVRHPGNNDMTTLATQALIQAVIPEWSYKLDAMLFEPADTLLAEAATMSPDTADSRQILQLLGWISELERFAGERNGMSTPLQLFQHEDKVTSLLARWDENAHQHELMMIRIIHYVPEFEAIRARVSSYMRILRNDKAVYLKAIAGLKQNLSKQLLAADSEAAVTALEQFERQYPKIDGIEPLRADLTQLAVLQQAVQDKKLSSVLQLYTYEYATPLISSVAAQWTAAHLPAVKDLAHYQAALTAWRRGQTGIAATLLQPLTELTWGDMATAKLEHFETVARAYEKLAASRDSSNYSDRLLAFYNLLEPLEDRFFSDALAADMAQYGETALNAERSTFGHARE